MKRRKIFTVKKLEPEKRDIQVQEFEDIRGGEDNGEVMPGEVAVFSAEIDEDTEEKLRRGEASNLIAIEDVEEYDTMDFAGPVAATDLQGDDLVPQNADLAYSNSIGITERIEAGEGSPENVRVAIIDTGISKANPVFESVVAGRSFVPGYAWEEASNPHGGHVAGSAHVTGTGLLVARVFGTGGARNDHILQAIYWAADNGADVMNLSLGGMNYTRSISAENAASYARQRGCQLFAAAGNDGGQVNSPARQAGFTAISAFDRNTNRKASFSCFGPEVQFAESGVGVVSYGLNGGLVAFSGTSMATPNAVYDFAALRCFASTGVITAMRRTAVKVADAPKEYQGWGRINAEAALLRLQGEGVI